jgi:hypothetical protein
MRPENRRRALTLGAFVALAALFGGAGPGGVTSQDLGASPAGRRAPFEIRVILETRELPRRFEHVVPLTRAQYEQVRFSPKRHRDRALKKARQELARKLGYDPQLFSSRELAQVGNSKVVDILLIETAKESRPGGRMSIRQGTPIS